MNELESLKEQMLDMFEQFKEIDINKTPGFYLISKIRDRLCLHHGFSKELAKQIAGSLNVDLPLLGTDCEEHKDFLDSMSRSVAQTIKEIWPVIEDGFGREAALKKVCEINVYMKG